METLRQLMSAYFHQDWNHTHDSWEAVVDAFAADDRSKVAAAPGEIDRLLARATDEELSQPLLSLEGDYSPDEGDRAWLGWQRVG